VQRRSFEQNREAPRVAQRRAARQANREHTQSIIRGNESNFRQRIVHARNGNDSRGSVEAYGCTLNTLTVEQIFDQYERSGFLYTSKRERLAPVWSHVEDTWRRSIAATDAPPIHVVLGHGDPASGHCSSLSLWRTTHGRIHSQHMVSCGDPLGTANLLMAAQDHLWFAGSLAVENWFRANNRLPMRLFASCIDAVGPDHGCMMPRQLVRVPRVQAAYSDSGVSLHDVMHTECTEASDALERLAGRVVAASEDLRAGDVGLEHLDGLYQARGLQRRRRVMIAKDGVSGRILGIALAYRGPLGLSFSFLENRCDLYVTPTVEPDARMAIAMAIVHELDAWYADLPLMGVMCAVDPDLGMLMTAHGCEPGPVYTRTVWLRPGFCAWYQAIERAYARLIEKYGTAGREQPA